MMREVPRWPRVLGLAGLSPQLACLVAAYLGPAHWLGTATSVALIYAALIFTFLGGAWWGMAAGAPAAERRGGLAWLWVAAVVPSLIATAGLVARAANWLPAESVLVMLGAGLLLALAVDARLGALAPRWWMQLRAPLSIGLGVATIAIALA